jgi:polyisoprenoid-binding protein YceI
MTDSPTAVAKLRSGALQGHWVVDPAASTAEFAVKHFWGLVTVRGRFDRLSGEGSVDAAGVLSGQLTMEAGSVNTKNSQRDKHLRSADFFDAEHHPSVVLTVAEAEPHDDGRLAAKGTLTAAGRGVPVSFTAQVEMTSDDAVTLRADLEVDRSAFGMTWSPLGMAAKQAAGTVVARFTRG